MIAHQISDLFATLDTGPDTIWPISARVATVHALALLATFEAQQLILTPALAELHPLAWVQLALSLGRKAGVILSVCIQNGVLLSTLVTDLVISLCF